MPIYDYVCGACSTTTEVVHGIHDEGPRFCPACGVKGRMKKAFAPPTIVFKGSGWAKKDRSSTSTPRASRSSKDESTTKADAGTASATKATDASGTATTTSSDD
jgi:putative FmdB family regulatory protein